MKQSVYIIAKCEIVAVIAVIANNVVPGCVELPDNSDCIGFLTDACVRGTRHRTGCIELKQGFLKAAYQHHLPIRGNGIETTRRSHFFTSQMVGCKAIGETFISKRV